jgi:hypothetical protein
MPDHYPTDELARRRERLDRAADPDNLIEDDDLDRGEPICPECRELLDDCSCVPDEDEDDEDSEDGNDDEEEDEIDLDDLDDGDDDESDDFDDSADTNKD